MPRILQNRRKPAGIRISQLFKGYIGNKESYRETGIPVFNSVRQEGVIGRFIQWYAKIKSVRGSHFQMNERGFGGILYGV